MDGVTEGRIVHYVLPEGNNPGAHRPALIVNAWNDSPNYSAEGRVNLHVFPDFGNDGVIFNSGSHWATSVPYDGETKAKGTWHWIEKVEPERVKADKIVVDELLLAKQAYYAFGNVTDFRTYSGDIMKPFEDLTPTIIDAWKAAARVSWNDGYNWEVMHKSK